MSKLKIAFIGMDHVHVQTLYREFVKYPDVYEIVGIADYPKNCPDMIEYKKRHNFPKQDLVIWDDYKTLLNQGIDVAVITTNIKDHTKCAVETLGMNIHTVLEKPMAVTMEDAKIMYDAYKNSKAELVINWPVAWFSSFRKAKEIVDSGVIGDVLRVQYRTPSTRGPYSLKDHTEDELRAMWWYQSDKGGGSIFDYAGYGCNLTTWFAGKCAQRVTGMKKNFMQKFCDCEDYSNFIADFGDCIGFIEGSWSTCHSGDIPTGPVVFGTKGTVVCDRYDSHVRVYLDNRQFPDAESPYQDIDTQPIEDNIALNLSEFILDNKPLFEMVTVDFNMKVMGLLDAGIRSCESGKTEEVISYE